MSADVENQSRNGKNRVFLETFGCQMNILDSELIEGQFRNAGFDFVDNADDANIVLLNTCSVRYSSEHKVYSRLGKLKLRKEQGEKLVVGVLGCMAERTHDELLKKRPFIDVLVGPSKIKDTLSLVSAALHEKDDHETKKSLSYFVKRKGALSTPVSPFDDLEVLDSMRQTDERKKPWQAYVRITRGCNKFCSFCVVPRTRGPEVHRPPESIIEEIKRLTAGGAKEVTLLGQTINHYFFESGRKHWSFADLLFNIHEQVPDLSRLRFMTSYPRDFTDDALDVMKSCERISKYLHIPAQSGSDKVLKEMNRGYDLETYLSLVERAKSRMPDISLIGDMIVGFPNESDEDFQKSIDLLHKVRYKNVFVFKYSSRPDTVASRRFLDNVSEEVKILRNNIMLATQNQISLEHHQAMVGKSFVVLCEGASKLDRETGPNTFTALRNAFASELNLSGRTTGDHIVHFRHRLSTVGTFAKVRITHARSLSLDGVVLENHSGNNSCKDEIEYQAGR